MMVAPETVPLRFAATEKNMPVRQTLEQVRICQLLEVLGT